MPTPTYTAVLLLSVGALVTGILISWVRFRLRTGSEFVPLAVHREELVTMRRRYRRRLRGMRDLVLRHKLNEDQLRSELRTAEAHHATQAKLLTAGQAEISKLRERIAIMDAEIRDLGLLRIERDELAAQTQRLRALSMPAPDAEAPAPVAATASRADLADRNARIHDLECQLRERQNRMSELESSLHTWKYRIAPLALHMKMQRDRARKAANGDTPPAPAARPNADDLKRIRGIGRGLEKKLRAEGVTEIAQLAGMSPAELANLAVKVGVAASRPQRDRWAEQARELRNGNVAAAG